MIIGLDHIAIAVGDFEKAIQRFLEDFGIPLDGTEDVISAKTKATRPQQNAKTGERVSPKPQRQLLSHLKSP